MVSKQLVELHSLASVNKEIILGNAENEKSPIFQGLQKLWRVVKCAGFRWICNTYATQIKRYIGHFSVRNYWKMSSFNYILLIASTSSFTSKWVYTFSVNVIAPECPTIFLMIVWSVPASANIEMQVCLQQ